MRIAADNLVCVGILECVFVVMIGVGGNRISVHSRIMSMHVHMHYFEAPSREWTRLSTWPTTDSGIRITIDLGAVEPASIIITIVSFPHGGKETGFPGGL